MALEQVQHPQEQYLRHSPEDGAFILLATKVNGERKYNQYGYLPPYGIFVEFELLDGNGEKLKGMTASLGSMGPWLKHDTVFVTVEAGQKKVFFTDQVAKWRELIDYKDFTEEMLKFTWASKPEVY